jgi:hypothetical protein
VTTPAGGVAAAPGAPPPPPAGTLLAALSEDFSQPAPYVYSLAQFLGAVASVSFASGAAVATVTTTGAVAWHLQLVSPFVPLPAASGPGYSARLRASASIPTSVNVLWLQEATFAVVGLRTFALGPAAQLLELEPVTLPAGGGYHLQVGWARGGGGCAS